MWRAPRLLETGALVAALMSVSAVGTLSAQSEIADVHGIEFPVPHALTIWASTALLVERSTRPGAVAALPQTRTADVGRADSRPANKGSAGEERADANQAHGAPDLSVVAVANVAVASVVETTVAPISAEEISRTAIFRLATAPERSAPETQTSEPLPASPAPIATSAPTTSAHTSLAAAASDADIWLAEPVDDFGSPPLSRVAATPAASPSKTRAAPSGQPAGAPPAPRRAVQRARLAALEEAKKRPAQPPAANQKPAVAAVAAPYPQAGVTVAVSPRNAPQVPAGGPPVVPIIAPPTRTGIPSAPLQVGAPSTTPAAATEPGPHQKPDAARSNLGLWTSHAPQMVGKVDATDSGDWLRSVFRTLN